MFLFQHGPVTRSVAGVRDIVPNTRTYVGENVADGRRQLR